MGHPGLGVSEEGSRGRMLASGEVMARGRARKRWAGKQGWWITTRATGSTNEEGRGAFPVEDVIPGVDQHLRQTQLPNPPGVFCFLELQVSVTQGSCPSHWSLSCF